MEQKDKDIVRGLLDSCSPAERARIARFFLEDLPHAIEVRRCMAAAMAIQQDEAVSLEIAAAWRRRAERKSKVVQTGQKKQSPRY